MFNSFADFRQRGSAAARENIFGNPGIGDARRSGAADGVHQRYTILRQQVAHLLEICIIERAADMLEHADTDDSVVDVSVFAIVGEFKSHIAYATDVLLAACNRKLLPG